jgi:pimeloyl-ACP methyl ester carboxylesterase
VTDLNELAAIADDASRLFGPVFAAVQAGDNETAVRVLLDGSSECAQLAALRMPVAIRWGELTRPFFGVVSRAAARCIGGRFHGAIANARHLWPEEDPAPFAREVASFYRGAGISFG